MKLATHIANTTPTRKRPRAHFLDRSPWLAFETLLCLAVLSFVLGMFVGIWLAP